MVEFALVLPVFQVIIFAIVDLGWALKAYITVTNSAREGARVAVVGATDADIKTKAVDTSAGLLSTGEVSVSNSVEQGERGQVLVFTALTMAFFLGLVALAVDVGL
jgi:Flp pilus assembly protein TadG